MGIIFNNNGKKNNLFIGDLFMVWNNAKNHVHLQWPLFQLNFNLLDYYVKNKNCLSIVIISI